MFTPTQEGTIAIGTIAPGSVLVEQPGHGPQPPRAKRNRQNSPTQPRRLPIGLIRAGLVVLAALLSGENRSQATPFTPLIYQPKLITWKGDENRNSIDDRIERLPGEELVDLVVVLNKCLAPDAATKMLGRYGKVTYVGRFMTFVSLVGVKASAALAIAKLEDVSMVEQDVMGRYNLNVSTRAIRARSGAPYSPNTVEDAFPGIDGTGIGIAILDSGVDDQGAGSSGTTHSFLPAAKVVGTYDAVADVEGSNPNDTFGHGTHVAGIALGTGGTAGVFRGVAPNANLIDMLIGSTAPCTSAAMRAVEKCIERRVAWGIRVIQTSFSIGGNSDGQDALSQMFNLAVANGIVCVAAAGNGGANILASPAAADDVITVANFNDQGTVNVGDDVISSGSNIGPRLSDSDGSGQDELKPDVAAPGENITSAQANSSSGTIALSGTSMAAPHVSGVAALILQARPTMNPLSVKDLIKRSADDRNGASSPGLDPVWDTSWGQGALNAFNALSMVSSTDVGFPNAPPTCCGCPDVFAASPPRVGVPNTLTCVVRNNGPGAVVNATVSLGVYVFGNGATFYSVGQRTISIPAAGGTVNVSVPWTPQASPTGEPHACLKAEIGYGPDTDYGNNTCQRNIEIQQTSTAVFMVHIENHLELPAQMVIVPTGQIDERWKLEISTNNFVLDPFSCPQPVAIRLTSPANAAPEAMQHIGFQVFADVFGQRFPQSGFEIVGCHEGGEPPKIQVLERVPNEREIVITDAASGISHVKIVEQNGGEVFIPPYRTGAAQVILRARSTTVGKAASFVIEAQDCAFNPVRTEFVIPASNIVLFEGQRHYGLGDASLVLRSNMLVVGNLGKTGNDGVRIPIGKADFLMPTLPGLTLANLPNGAFLRFATRGEVNNGSQQPMDSLLVRNIEGTAEFTPDFKASGSRSYTVLVHNAGKLVSRVSGVTESAFRIRAKLPPFRIDPWCMRPRCWWIIRFPRRIPLPDPPPEIFIGNERPVLGDQVVLIPEKPTTEMGFVEEMSITAGGGLNQFSLEQEQLGVFHLAHRALGETEFAAAGDRLMVGGENARSTEGFTVDLEKAHLFDIQWDKLTPCTSDSLVPCEMSFNTRGYTGKAHLQDLGLIRIRNGAKLLELDADFSPVGSETQTIELYREGKLVNRVVGHKGQVATFPTWPYRAGKLGQPPHIFPRPLPCYFMRWRDLIPITVIGERIQNADEIRVLTEKSRVPLVYLENFEMRTAGFASFSVVAESRTPALDLEFSPPVLTPNGLRLSFETEFGFTYALESTSTIAPGTPVWTVLSTSLMGDGGVQTLTVPLAPNRKAEFLRLNAE